MDSDPVTVATFVAPFDAQLARGFLESHGIEAFLAVENTCSNAWHLTPILGGIRLQVRGEMAPLAPPMPMKITALAAPMTSRLRQRAGLISGQ